MASCEVECIRGVCVETAEIELMIINKVSEIADKIADKCLERIKNAQCDCEAYRIFREKDNVKRFFDLGDRIDRHVEMHKNEDDIAKTTADIFYKRMRLVIGIIGIANIPAFALMVTKLFWK